MLFKLHKGEQLVEKDLMSLNWHSHTKICKMSEAYKLICRFQNFLFKEISNGIYLP